MDGEGLPRGGCDMVPVAQCCARNPMVFLQIALELLHISCGHEFLIIFSSFSIFLLKSPLRSLQNRTFCGFDAEIRFWSRLGAREELG
jgi:hypothetical protein